MSDNGDSSDDMDELHDIIAEYEAKERQNNVEANNAEVENNATKKVKSEKPESAEVPMDKLLFGDKAGVIKRLAKAANAKVPNEVKEEGDEDDNTDDKRAKKRPAWTDDDDNELVVGDVKRTDHKRAAHLRKDQSYKEFLTSKFVRQQTQPKWAKIEEKRKTTDDDSEDEELLRTVGFIAKSSQQKLASHHITIHQVKDLNRATYSEGNITSIEFHPTSMAALVTGERGVASIYAIDGRQNEKLHNMFFQGFSIKCARITPCGTKAIFGSKCNYYYMYDLLTAQEQRYRLPKEVTSLRRFKLSPCGRYMAVPGRFGELHLFHAKSNELLHTFKQEGRVEDVCFTGNSQQLVSNSEENLISIFSMRQHRMEHSFYDDGCIHGSVLDLAPSQRMLATGSKEGVVNVYNFDSVLQTKTPQPVKSFMNLTTSVSHVQFNHSSELLGFCSNLVPNAVKIAHFPSATVYANYPRLNSEFGKVAHVHFSPNSGYFALGSYKKAPLFRLKFFKSY